MSSHLLNPAQKKAAQALPGVTLVIAGAGTGKTKTIVEAIRNILIRKEYSAESILVLTFSRKAAEEIKERVARGIGQEAEGITSGTFHSFSLKLLKQYSRSYILQKSFQQFPNIIDEAHSDEICRSIIRQNLHLFLGLPMDVIINIWKNYRKYSPSVQKKLVESGILKKINEIDQVYVEYKKMNHLMDYHDMVEDCIYLMNSDERIHAEVKYQYRYIFVDEFQDTSDENFQLLKLLLDEESPNLFAVGDDWQSIYGFRDANIDYIINLSRYLPKPRIIKLTMNYRSKKEIVELSNRFIKKNRRRSRKTVRSFSGKGGCITYIPASDYRQEYELLSDLLGKIYNGSGSIAVLFRNNWQGDYIRTLFHMEHKNPHGIQYMTMHGSKGLEFDTVVIIGLSDDIIPDGSSDLEEERRLLYVALTRAKKELYIIHHVSKDKGISRFARELGISPSRIF